MTESTTGEVLLARSIRGGFAGGVRSACSVHSDGRCTIEEHGSERSGQLDAGQIDLLRRICDATDTAGLPDRIDTPVTRTDGFTWTYRIGDHETVVRDADTARDLLPPALHVIDAIADALSKDAS